MKVSINDFPWYKKIIFHLRFTRPNWYRKYHSYAISHYFNLAVLFIFCVIIGAAMYSAFVNGGQKSPSLAAGPASPLRILSFQGRLTDNLDNPITSSRNLRFTIYSDSSASASARLWEEVDNVGPDQDGIFSVLLGSNGSGGNASLCNGGNPPTSPPTGPCGIPQSLFAQNAQLWLGVTVENGSELTPRQQLATVAYASNAETLQGLPPTTDSAWASAGTNGNAVLALSSNGVVNIAGNANAVTVVQAASSQIKLTGNVTTIATNPGSNGNVQIIPDGSGWIDAQKPIFNSTLNSNLRAASNNASSSAGAVEVDDLFAVLATSSGQSAVTIDQDGVGPIISASHSGSPVFTVGAFGDTSIAGNTNISGNLTLNNSLSGNVSSNIIPTQNMQFDLGSSTLMWRNIYAENIYAPISGGTSGFWQLNSGAISPANLTNDLLLGSAATASATFGFINVAQGTPTATISAGTTIGALYLTATGKLATTNDQNLNIGDAGTGNIILSPVGGTGTVSVAGSLSVTTFNQQGGVIYQSGTTGQLAVNTTGTTGQCLISNGTAAPFWAACSTGSVNGINYWTMQNGALNTINNTADLLVGGTSTASAKFAILGINNNATVASISAQNTNSSAVYVDAANNALQTVKNQNLTIGGATTGNIFLAPLGGTSGLVTINGSLALSTFANQGGVVYQSGTNGQLNVNTTGGSGQCLVSGGTGAPTWQTCATGNNGVNWWTLQNGALNTINNTADLLVGGTSTASAHFSILGINTNTTIASVSAQNAAGSAISLDTVNSSLQTQNNRNFTIGGNTTGNITISPLGGAAGSTLNINANTIALGGTNTAITNTGSNTLTLNNGSTGNIQFFNANNFVTSTGSLQLQGNILLPVTGGTDGFWQLANNVISPSNTINDLVVGGNSTASAKFHVYGSTGNVTIGTTASPLAALDVRATSTTTPVASISGNTSGAVMVADQTGSGNIFSANQANAARFVIANNGTLTSSQYTTAGGILYTNGSGNFQQTPQGNNTQCLMGGAVPSWSTCALGTNWWTVTNGTLFPINQTLDFLIGGNSTASAHFGILGVNNNATIASISAQNAAGNALSLDTVAGQIQTANNQSLTIGGNATGNITISPLNGSSGSTLNINANTIALGGTNTAITNTGSNTLTLNSGSTGNIQFFSNVNTLTSGGNLTLAGTITLPNSNTLTGVTNFLQLNNGLELGGGITTYITGNGTANLSNVYLPVTGGIGGFWQLGSNVIAPTNLASDFAIGGNSTASAKFQVFSNGNATTTGTLTFNSANQQIQTTANQTLSFGGSTTGNIILSPLNAAAGGFVAPALNNVTDLGQTTLNFRNVFATTYNSGANVGQTISNTSCVNTVGGIVVSNGSCGTQNWWTMQNGLLYPINSTLDLAVGGSATGSAIFAVTGSTSTGATAVPTASVSATTGNFTGNGIILAGNGSIQSLRNNNLTIGGATTGNITLSPLNGGAGSTLSVNALSTLLNGALAVNQTGAAAAKTTIDSSGNVLPGSNIGGANLGSPSLYWTNLYASAINANAVFLPVTGGTDGFWQLGNNVIAPSNLVNDFAVGGNGTASAKFQVLANSIAGQPAGTATTSGNLSFRGANTKVNLLNGINLGFYTSNGGDSGESSPSLFIASAVNGTAGNVGINTSNPTASLDVAGAASISGSLTFRTGAGTIQTTGTGNLTIGGATTGNIFINPLNTVAITGNLTATGNIQFSSLGLGVVHSSTNGTLSSSAVNLASADVTGILPLGNGGTNTALTASNGGIVYSDSSKLQVLAGTPIFGQCLISGINSAPSWATCASGGAGINYWTNSSGAIYPINNTLDLYVGGTSTASAKFAVLDMAGGTPVASISAQDGSGKALLLSGNGTIQSMNMQNLNLGGSTTGNIVLSPDNGNGAVILNIGGSQLSATGQSLDTTSGTFNLLNSSALTVNFAGAATALTMGAATGTTTINNNILVKGSQLNSNQPIFNLLATPFLLNIGTSSTTASVGGNFVIGSSASNTLTVNALLNQSLIPTAGGTVNLGSSANPYNVVYANAFSTPVGNGVQGFWTVTNNTNLYPTNSADDLLIGGTGTGSAAFQIFADAFNNGTSVPAGTATTSGNLTFFGSSTNHTINALNGGSFTFQTSTAGQGDTGLTSVLNIANNGDLSMAAANVNTTANILNLFNSPTTITLGSAASTFNIGAGTGFTQVNNEFRANA
ncbi:MAG: S-layer family protein, partial [Patescibacteria group bacterium]|nr:S-layer family protein [Patescibacteria group bacterium]